MKQKVCTEKTRLLGIYQQATVKYSQAVAQLNQSIGTSSKADYDALYRMTEALRLDAVKVKEDLDEHVAEHHC